MASKQIDRASTAKSGDSRRERLLDIQKREQLKGLLINKFKVKYSEKGTDLAKYIDNEVSKFLKNDRLSEDNLKKLEEMKRLVSLVFLVSPYAIKGFRANNKQTNAPSF